MSSAYPEGDLAQLWPHYTIDPDKRETPSELDNEEMRRAVHETRAARRAHEVRAEALVRQQAREELAHKREEIQDRRRRAETSNRAQAEEALIAKERQRLPQDEQPVYPAR